MIADLRPAFALGVWLDNRVLVGKRAFWAGGGIACNLALVSPACIKRDFARPASDEEVALALVIDDGGGTPKVPTGLGNNDALEFPGLR